MKIALELRWRLSNQASDELPRELIALLDGVARGGNLRYAAGEAKLSYRHAWGLVKHWEQRLEAPLLVLEKGRGSDLTRAGEMLRELWHRTAERTAVLLQDASMHAERTLATLSTMPLHDRLTIAASHGFGVNALVDLLRKAQTESEVHFVGSEEALKRFAARECDIAGFHLPRGKHGRTLWTRFQRYLDSRHDALLLVETRELGFMARAGSARVDMQRLVREKLRFQNRQVGSGSRLVFDLLMQEAGVKPAQITGYHHEEYTHIAVAAVIASGEADVGFGARAAAEKFNLAFWPEITEKYLLAVARENLKRKPLSSIPRVLSSVAYKNLLSQTSGTDSRGTGKQIELKHVLSLIRTPMQAVHRRR